MIKKNFHRLAVVDGSRSAASSHSSLFTRLLRTLHLQRPAARHNHAVEPLAEAAAALPLYEHHCASEQEAREYATAMTRQGTWAEVAYDPYDYSWSVEVFGPAGHAPRQDT